LGYSEFARHYYRNHGCFLLLGVLRWFTSPGSPRHPMYSDDGNGCSHPLGFPIRKSPDHSLLAASRGLSQLTTSFFAYLRQGIHTHALSSLTIKSTSHTTPPSARSPSLRRLRRLRAMQTLLSSRFLVPATGPALRRTPITVCMPVKYSVVKDRLFLRIQEAAVKSRVPIPAPLTSDFCLLFLGGPG
jgi:hypothetical protein